MEKGCSSICYLSNIGFQVAISFLKIKEMVFYVTFFWLSSM